jgi:hypothetical protein
MEGTKVTATATGQARTEFSINSPTTATYYTFSVYAKRGSTPYAALYTYFDPYTSPAMIANLDTGQIVFSDSTITTSLERINNDWWRLSMTVIVQPDQTHRLFKLIQTSSSSAIEGGVAGDYVYYWGVQLEQKDRLTAFTDSTRTSIVKDYSMNNNNASLPLTTTPSWISNGIVGKGAYSFDGIDDTIDLGNVSDNILKQGTESNDFTLSAWIKNTNFQDAANRIIVARYGYHNGLQTTIDGKVYFGIFDENNSNKNVTSPVLDLNVAHYVVGTYTNKIMYLYVDGKLVGTNNFFNANPTVKFRVNTSTFTSGAASDGNSHQFRGIIDDIRIYNRALNATEIKYNYDILKYKIK